MIASSCTTRTRDIVITAALLAAALLAGAPAGAQPHAPPPPWKDPAGPPTQMDIWLRRLVGRYRFEGLVHLVARGDCAPPPPDPAQQANPPPPPPPYCQSVEGMGDCIGIGSGPGVQCVLDLRWQQMYDVDFEAGTVDALPGAIPYLNPAMAMFGIDQANSSMRYLLVDNKGLPEGGSGMNTGNRATFVTPCVNQPVSCQRTIRIEARPDANLIYMWIDVESGYPANPVSSIMLTMRRVPVAPVTEAPVLPPARRRR